MVTDYPRETAADLVANAAFILMADELGVSALLDKGEPFSRDDLVDAAQNNADGVGEFLGALIAAGLVEPAPDDADRFVPAGDYGQRRYEAGYLTWALTASSPHVENVAEFIADYDAASAKHQRDGRRVAVSSRWMGSYGAAPFAFAEITGRRPARLVDLGAGSGVCSPSCCGGYRRASASRWTSTPPRVTRRHATPGAPGWRTGSRW